MGKNLHNRLPTVLHGFLLVASLNHLAISENEHKETISLLLGKLREQKKMSRQISCVEQASWVISPVWECPPCPAGQMVFLMRYYKSFINEAFSVKMA